MAISPCNSATDADQRELTAHGSLSFPIACYRDDLYRQSVPWHWHEEFEYAIAQSEQSIFFIENAQVCLQPGEGLFINSQVLHAVERAQNEGAGLLSAVFHPRLIGEDFQSLFWQTRVRPLLSDCALRYIVLSPQVPWQAQILAHFHTAWQAMEQEPEDYPNTVRYHLSAALHLLVKNSPQVTQPQSEQQRLDALRARGMLEYIHAHYTEDVTMKDICASISASSSVCLRCFHQLLGTTPIQYLKNYRLEKAAQLLQETARSAKEVALDCGFNDISYFTKAFREKTGTTPKEYQRKARSTP